MIVRKGSTSVINIYIKDKKIERVVILNILTVIFITEDLDSGLKQDAAI